MLPLHPSAPNEALGTRITRGSAVGSQRSPVKEQSFSVTSFYAQDREDKSTGVTSLDFWNRQRILQALDEQGDRSRAAESSAGSCVESAAEKYGLLKVVAPCCWVYFSFYRLVERRWIVRGAWPLRASCPFLTLITHWSTKPPGPRDNGSVTEPALI